MSKRTRDSRSTDQWLQVEIDRLKRRLAQVQVIAGPFPGGNGANPTAQVILTPVNGAATTWMRSDAAPPLSQAISPTMTGTWNFTPSADATPVTINAGAVLINGNMQAWTPLVGEDTVVDSAGDVGVGEPVPTAMVSILQRSAPAITDQDILDLDPYAWWDGDDIDGDGSFNSAYADGGSVLHWVDRANGHALEVVTAGVTNYSFKQAFANGHDGLGSGAGGGQGTPEFKAWTGTAFDASGPGGTRPATWTAFGVIKASAANLQGLQYFLFGSKNIFYGPSSMGAGPGWIGAPNYVQPLSTIITAIRPPGGTSYKEAFTTPDTTSIIWNSGGNYFYKCAFRYNGGTSWEIWIQDQPLVRSAPDCVVGTVEPNIQKFYFLNGYASNLGGSGNLEGNPGDNVAYTYFHDTFCAGLIFSRALSNDEMATVQTFLSQRYDPAFAAGPSPEPMQDWKLQNGTVDSIVTGSLTWGIGTAAPIAKLHVIDTAEQLRLGYDTDSYTGLLVTSGSVANIYTLPTTSAVGVLHNTAPTGAGTGANPYLSTWSWSLVSLTGDVSGILPIARGGTNSGAALSGSSIIISNGTAIVQGAAGTTVTVLHGNAAGAPTYGAVSLTTDVSGVLPLANGGTNKALTAVDGGVVYTDSDSMEITAAGTTSQVLVGGTPPSFGAVPLAALPAHNLLSASHGDTLTASVARGDVIIGNATPKWSRLGIGTAAYVLTSDGTDVSWQPAPGAGGGVTGTGTANVLTKWLIAGTSIQDSGISDNGTTVTVVEHLEITGTHKFTLPITTAATMGVVFKAAESWMHDFTTTADRARVIGLGAPYASGLPNLFLGWNAGNFTLSGASSFQGTANVGVGEGTLRSLTTGFSNVALGWRAGGAVTTGSLNFAMGESALGGTTTGLENIGLGTSAGITNDTGRYNVLVGSYADVNASNLDNAVAIGYGVVCDASSKVIIGNTDDEVVSGTGTTLVELRGAMRMRDQASHLFATFDLTKLTGDRIAFIPDNDGTLWIDALGGTNNGGLSSIDDPLLSWTPVVAGGGGIRCYAGLGGYNFQASQNGSTGLVTLTTAVGTGGKWIIAGTGTPILEVSGAFKASTINLITITQPASGSTLTIANAKTFTVSNTLTLTGTDGSSVAFGAGGTVLYANQTITLSGEVTGSGTTAITTTIANDAVTYAKMQNVSATDKVLGRSTAGAGDVEEIACTAAGRAILDDANAAAQRITLGLELWVATQADTAVNSVTDVTIVSQAMAGIAAGDQLIAEGSFQILNNSGANRAYAITMDWDSLFDIEITTFSLTVSATAEHVFFFKSILDVRSTTVAYCANEINGGASTGLASGADSTMSGTANARGVGWGTVAASDATGSTTFDLKVRSANATATQTCRLHNCTIRRVTPS